MLKVRSAVGSAFIAVVIASSAAAPEAVADATSHASPAVPQTTTATAESMAGMDHGSTGGMDPNMPMEGMNHAATPASPTQSTAQQATGEQEAGKHSHSNVAATAAPPPRELALGGFVALNGAVLAAARFLRGRSKRPRLQRAHLPRSPR